MEGGQLPFTPAALVSAQGEAKERFNAIAEELSQLSTTFSNHVLDATKAYKKLLTQVEEVEGLPPTALQLAAQQAVKEGHEGATPEAGPWLFTLDFPRWVQAQAGWRPPHTVHHRRPCGWEAGL